MSSVVTLFVFSILILFAVQVQGSQWPGKSWKTWKMKNAFSRPGKIMEFEKRPKSWKNHGISKYLYGKIMEKNFDAPRIPCNTNTSFSLL